MSALKYKTRGNSLPGGKPRVYISDYAEKDTRWRDILIAELLELCDCVVFYYEGSATQVLEESHKADLDQMQLMVIPVTRALFGEENHTLQTDLPYALEHKIAVLPIAVEGGILEGYSKAFGQIQFLDRADMDSSARCYKEKLTAFLNTALYSEEQAQQVRKAFDSYIFLSYRKKDRNYANALMRIIHNTENFSDVAIWYDEYLVPGEDFTKVIDKALKAAPVFMLTVTPNLLTPGNYVMKCEYPAAVRHSKPILPVMMENTDQTQLKAAYVGIPDCADPENGEMLQQSLYRCFDGIPLGNNKNDPEHMYLIGLAYLNGIDVEVDRNRAADCIERAAMAGHLAATEKITEMYTYGIGVVRDWIKAQVWQLRLHRIYQRAYRNCALSKKDCPITQTDRQILQKYLKNLQSALVDAPYINSKTELPQWAMDAWRYFFRIGENITDMETVEIIADVRLSCYHICNEGGKALVKQMKELCRQENSEKRQILLVRAYMCNGDFRKAEKLCRHILKKNKDVQVMLYLAQNLSELACGDGRDNARQKQMVLEALQLCWEITENNQNFPAIRALAEIWLRHDFGRGLKECSTWFQQIYERVKQMYLQTKDKDDLKLLKRLCWNERWEAKNAEQKALYARRDDAFNQLYYFYRVQERPEKLRYAVQLARQANKQNFKSAEDWDDCVDILELDLEFNERYGKSIPEMAELLRCKLRGLHRHFSRCRQPACELQLTWQRQSAFRELGHSWEKLVDRTEEIWYATTDPDVADVYIELLMDLERHLVMGLTPEEKFADCVKAMGIYCEKVSLDWRLCTWQRQPFPNHNLARMQEYFTGYLGVLMAEDPKVGEETGAKKNSFIANSYLSALQEWEKGNWQEAANHCLQFMKIENEADSLGVIVAANEELLLSVYQHIFGGEHPKVTVRQLTSANNHRKADRHGASKLIMKINYSQMADAALQMGDKVQARTYLEKAANLYVGITENNKPIVKKITDQYRNLIREVAPKEANQLGEEYMQSVQAYLCKQVHIDIELAGEYVASLPEDAVPDYEDKAIVMALALAGPRPEHYPYVSRLLYNGMCASTLVRPIDALQYLEACVDRDASLENRRYFAKIVERVPMLPEEALAEDAVANAAWIGRVEKAKTLFAEVEQQWTEADAILFRDLQRLLSEARTETADVQQMARDKQQQLDDHALEKYESDLSNTIDRVVYWSYTPKADKFHKKFRKTDLQQLQELIESPLLESLGEKEWKMYIQEIRGVEGSIKNTKALKILQQTRKKLVQVYHNKQKNLPPEERKAILRSCGAAFVAEGLAEEDRQWVEALYEKETQGADAKDLALYNKEYADIYMALGLYDKAYELHIAYVESIESMTSKEYWQQGNAIISVFHAYVEQKRWKEANLFFKRSLAVCSLCVKEGSMDWTYGALSSLISNVFYATTKSAVTDKEFIAYFGESLEALETLVKEAHGFSDDLIRRYCNESGRKILGKRAIALAKELGYSADKLKDLRKDIRRYCR